MPTDRYKTHWEWHYRVGFPWEDEVNVDCHHTRTELWFNKWTDEDGHENGGFFTTVSASFSLDLHPLEWATSTRLYDIDKENELYRQGKGGFLYTPGSDDPAACPGPDCSLYWCTSCEQYVRVWSDDSGELKCGQCEYQGLVMEDEIADKLEHVREIARGLGLSRQLERQIDHIATGWASQRCQSRLYNDFAPHSFSWSTYRLPDEPKQSLRHMINGELIYQGPPVDGEPGNPGDGSLPALFVSLTPGTGWFIHT
jgi:hypothetical protein